MWIWNFLSLIAQRPLITITHKIMPWSALHYFKHHLSEIFLSPNPIILATFLCETFFPPIFSFQDDVLHGTSLCLTPIGPTLLTMLLMCPKALSAWWFLLCTPKNPSGVKPPRWHGPMGLPIFPMHQSTRRQGWCFQCHMYLAPLYCTH